MTIIQWIYAADVAEYVAQGWQCTRLLAHHGARKGGRNFMAVIVI